METAIYITSKHKTRLIQFTIFDNGSPARTCPVILTDPIMIGIINGYNSIGNMISRVLRLADKEERSVPIVQNPSVPTKITYIKGNKCESKSTLKKIIKIGNMNASIINKNTKLLISFPK